MCLWAKFMRIIFIFCLFFCPFSASFGQSDKMIIRSINKLERAVCKDGTDSLTFNYSVSYPFFSDFKITKPITDSLNKYVRVVAGNYFMDSSLSKSLISVIKKESDSIYATWEHDLKVNFCYNLENIENIELIFHNKKFYSLVNAWYAYDGGAHPLSGEDYIVLDAKIGRKIESWKWLFTDTNLVKTIAKNEFYALKKREACDDANWFWGGDFYVSDNFAVLQNGILFYYQAYEIAPYAYGPTALFVKWDMLKKAKLKKRAY